MTITLDGASDDGEAGEADNVGTDVENLLGGTAADTLVGDGDANSLEGGFGNDILSGLGEADSHNGGEGADGVSFAASTDGVTVDLAAGTGSGGDAAGDTYTSIENVQGSERARHLVGHRHREPAER